MIVGEALGQVAAGSGGKAGEGVADHLLGVERIHDSLADLDVVPRLLGDVEHDEAGAETLNVIDLAAGALELVDGVSGNELHNERGALLLSGNASGGVGQDAVLDLLILGSILTVVLGVGNQGDLGIGDRVVHPGAGADRLLGAILLGLGGRGNADDGQTILEQGEVGDLGLDRHGAGVLGLDGLEGLEERSIGSGSGASGVGGNDIVSGDLGAIGKLGALADGDLESGVVHRLGIVGGELVEGAVVVVIDAVEALDDVPVSTQAHSGAGAGGIEAGRSVSGTSGDHAPPRLAESVEPEAEPSSLELPPQPVRPSPATAATLPVRPRNERLDIPLLMMAMSSPINRESYPGAPRRAPAQLADDIYLTYRRTQLRCRARRPIHTYA